MIIVFCQSPINPKQPDEMYQAEIDAARTLGLATRLINFEALVHEGNLDKALRSIPASEARLDAIYRGWMMPPEIYTSLFKGLCARGIYLINEPADYKHCHFLPEWLPEVGHNTPQTAVLSMQPADELSQQSLAENLACFGTSAIIVKDFVKSEKHHWEQACFIPDASDTEKALSVVRRFLELRGSDLQGGLVFRKFVPFRKLGNHPKSGMPLTEEFRAFVLDGKIINVMRYWDEVDYPETAPDLEKLLPLVASIPSRFLRSISRVSITAIGWLLN